MTHVRRMVLGYPSSVTQAGIFRCGAGSSVIGSRRCTRRRIQIDIAGEAARRCGPAPRRTSSEGGATAGARTAIAPRAALPVLVANSAGKAGVFHVKRLELYSDRITRRHPS